MHYGIFLVPLISAFIGWFTPWLAIRMLFRPGKAKKILGFRLQGVFPKRQEQIARDMAKLVSEQLFSMDEIEKKIADPDGFEKLRPLIETHIDDFLRVKLAKKMPIVSMFIGDKTITEMKTVFMAELDELFPVIMKNYLGGLKDKINIEAIIIEKVENFPSEKLELIVYQGLSKEFRYLGLFGATIGFLIGLLQALIAWLI